MSVAVLFCCIKIHALVEKRKLRQRRISERVFLLSGMSRRKTDTFQPIIYRPFRKGANCKTTLELFTPDRLCNLAGGSA